MVAGPWTQATVHLTNLVEAGRQFTGVDIIVKRQEKDYSLSYWYDCFASPVFRRKGLVEITETVQKAQSTCSKLETTMSGSLRDISSSMDGLLNTLSDTIGTKKGTERAELRKAVLLWKLREFTDFKHTKTVKAEASAYYKQYRKSENLGKPVIAALDLFVKGITSYISEILPLRKFRRKVSEAKQYAQLLLDATHTLSQSTAAHNASNPIDAMDSRHQKGYRSLTSLLSQEEKNELDDWRDDIKKLGGMIWELKDILDTSIKQEARSLAVQERTKDRKELERLLKEEEDPQPRRNKSRKSLEDIQQDLAEDAEREGKKRYLEDKIKGDKEERQLQKFDDDIALIRELGAENKLLSRAKFGFVTAGIIATNSYISDPVGTTHLKRNKIKWEWVAKSYLLFKNATIFGWKTSLEKDGFDPVFMLRRIKKRKPSSTWAKKDFQIFSPHFVVKDGYTYAVVMPALKTSSPGLNEDRDVTIRKWEFAQAE
jgi:hypothetical protein